LPADALEVLNGIADKKTGAWGFTPYFPELSQSRIAR
jgi:hypothetical protein